MRLDQTIFLELKIPHSEIDLTLDDLESYAFGTY